MLAAVVLIGSVYQYCFVARLFTIENELLIDHSAFNISSRYTTPFIIVTNGQPFFFEKAEKFDFILRYTNLLPQKTRGARKKTMRIQRKIWVNSNIIRFVLTKLQFPFS